MEQPSQVLRKVHVLPSSLEAKTYALSPNDIMADYVYISLAYPFFYNYDLDGERLKDALEKLLLKYPILCGRVQRHEDLRYVIEVDPVKGGVLFIEQSSTMSIATALLEHSKLKSEAGNFPVVPEELPFFIELADTDALLKGEEVLVKLKLTHFSDGCAVSIAIQHLMVDGQRYVEVCRDLSRAYRGIEIPERDLDRSYLWPDQLVKAFPFLGEDVAKLPRKVMPSGENYTHPQFPNDFGETHILHFSKETLQSMKDMIKPFLKEGEYVSSNDVISAFVWMLQCEFLSHNQPVSSPSDLDVDNTFCFSTLEVLKNGIKVVPENYVGNAFITHLIMNAGLQLDSASLVEVFAKLALLVRKAVIDLRTQPAVAAQNLMVYYVATSTGKLPIDLPMERHRALMTNLMKTPIDEVDYGQGGPVWAHFECPPLHSGLFQVGPGPHGDGAIVYAQLLGSQSALLQNSVVRQWIAPHARELYSEITLKELRGMLKLKEQIES